MGCVGHSTGAYESVFFSQLHIWLARLTIQVTSNHFSMTKHFAYILTISSPFIQQVLFFNHLFDYQGFTHIITHIIV